MKWSRVALCATILSLGAVVLAAPPALAVNHAPYVPSNMRIVEPRNAACPPASAPLLINAAPLFEARLTDTDGPVARIAARYEAYRTDTGARVWTGVTGFVSNGTTVRLRMDPTKVAHGLTYRFRAQAEDGSLASAWSGYCSFKIDTQKPTYVITASSDYPKYDAASENLLLVGRNGWDKAFGKPGQPGTFRFESPDAVEYRYRLDGGPQRVVRAATGPKHEASVSVTPPTYGLHLLEVAAVDAAGNVQEFPDEHRFRVGGAPGPTNEWCFDETSGAVAAASIGTKSLSLRGSPAWDTAGRLDGALRLDGADDNGRTSAVIDTAKSFSVSAWVRIDDQADQGRVLSQLNASGHGFALSYAKKRWTFGRSSSAGGRSVQSTADLVPGYWQHVLAVYDAAAGLQHLYVNGTAPIGIKALPGGAATGELVVGSTVSAAIDQLQIWPRALSVDEVIPLFDVRDAAQIERAELVARWKFEGGPATGGADSSGHGQQLSFGPDVAWGEDPKRGGFLRLNANGGNGSAQSSGPLFDGTSSFTIMAWVRPGATSGTAIGVGGTPPSDYPRQPNVELGAVHLPEVAVTEWEVAHGWWVVNGVQQRPAEWTRIALVWDSARQVVKLYLGDRYPAGAGQQSAWHSTERLTLGKVLAGSHFSAPFAGDIDDVRVYAGALTYTKIKQIMESTE